MSSTFNLLYRSPARENMHSIWQTTDGARFVISDQSGMTPETTDDGPLFVDPSRQVIADRNGMLWLPLLCPDGRESNTPTSIATVRRLQTFGCRLAIGGWYPEG